MVSVPHDGGWEDWWRGGMVRYTPGGTAPPLRLSPRRPPGVAQIIYPEEKNYPSMGRGTVIKRACYRAYCRVQEKGLKRAGVSPNGNRVKVFNGSPAMDEQFADIVNRAG